MTCKSALATFLGVTEEDVLELDDVRGKVLAYIREQDLKSGKTFAPDAKLAPILGEPRYIVSGDEKGFRYVLTRDTSWNDADRSIAVS